jgi:hypothetical protein
MSLKMIYLLFRPVACPNFQPENRIPKEENSLLFIACLTGTLQNFLHFVTLLAGNRFPDRFIIFAKN